MCNINESPSYTISLAFYVLDYCFIFRRDCNSFIGSLRGHT